MFVVLTRVLPVLFGLITRLSNRFMFCLKDLIMKNALKLTLVFAALPCVAMAENGDDVREQSLVPVKTNAVDEGSEPQSIWGNKAETTVGLGVAFAPTYFGADETKVVPLPSLSVYCGIFYVDTFRGLGVNYSTELGTYMSAGLGYDLGRAEKKNDWRPGSKKLRGMGNVKPSLTGTVLVAQEITPWLSINAQADLRLAGQKGRGNNYRVGVEVNPIPMLDSDKKRLTVGMNAHGGSRGYNKTYYGVSAEQSLKSGFKPHEMKAGIYAYSLTADYVHKFNQHWSAFAGLDVMEFAGKAKNSPIVKNKTGVTGTAGVYYSF